MAGGKLQLCDEKRFEQPQLASSQTIGAIGFPFEAIGKRIFIVAKLQLRGLSGTSPWSVFRVQSVLIQLSSCNKRGIPYMQGLCATRAAAYIAELRRLLRWSCSGPECGLKIAAGSNSFVTGMVTFCSNESSEYWQFGDSEVHIWLTCVQLSLI